MNTLIDRRIAYRRAEVSETGARRRLRRLLLVLGLFGIGGIAGWLFYHSPYLVVSDVRIDGWERSRAPEIVAKEGLAPGVPTIGVRRGAIESALEEDPWIAAALVRVTWPGTVDIEVLERVPTGWIEAGEGWLLADATGAVVTFAPQPGPDLARISLGTEAAEPGGEVGGPAKAALEFVAALPDGLAAEVEVGGTATNLTATVAGRAVVLGYPIDMAEKAAAVVALLETGLTAGVEINVVSPERPAVNTEPGVESSMEIMGDGVGTG